MGLFSHGFLPKNLLILDMVWKLYLAYTESLFCEIKKIIKAFSDHMGVEWQKLGRHNVSMSLLRMFTEYQICMKCWGTTTKFFVVLWHLLSKNPLEGRFCIYSQAYMPLKTFLKVFRTRRCRILGSSGGKR